uniref:Ankyrin repeat-containing domain n=1 Tax=Peronospora matthiolae TaxID=2874970 RepID=A0AAV1TJ69_9STRA
MTPHRRWHRLLGTETALTSIVSCLSSREAVRLLVSALAVENETLVKFLYAHNQVLSLGDAHQRFTSVLHCAAAYGCAEVVQRLLRFQLSYRGLGKRENCGQKGQKRTRIWMAQKTSPQTKVLAWCVRNIEYEFPAEVMYEAARQGDQDVVKWLHCCCQYERYRAMEYAGSTGRLEVVMWLYEQGNSVQNTNKTVDDEEDEGGDDTLVAVHMVQPLETKLQVLNWVAVFPLQRCYREVFASRAGLLADVFDQRDPLLSWTDADALSTSLGRKRYRALDTAAAQGDLVMVKKLHEDGRWPCTSRAMDMAAANGHLDIVKFLHANRREGGTAVGMCSAAGNGHLEVVQWLYQHRSSDGCRSMVLDLAATNGHLEVLRWLAPRFPRFSCSPAFLSSVAAQGMIKTLQYLHREMRMPLDRRTLEAAIGSGHVELVKYIAARVPIEMKSTLSCTAAEKAAASGNVELLAFVVEQLNVWSPQVLIAAACTGNVAMAKWIEKRMDKPSVGSEDIVLVRERRNRAVTSNAIDTMLPKLSLTLPLERRVSFDSCSITDCARPLDVVDGITLYRCAELCHFDMIEWLLQHRLAMPSFTHFVKELEIVSHSAAGRSMTDEDLLAAVDTSRGTNGETSAESSLAAGIAFPALSSATTTGSDVKPVGNGVSSRMTSVRTLTDDRRSRFDPFTWALPAKTSPYWQTKFVRLVLQYCPEMCLQLEWMPLWAAQRGDLFVLKHLYSVKHPQLFTKQTFTAIMRYTKAGPTLQWFQTHSPTLMGDSSIVKWGVKYRQFAYLTYVFLTFQPRRTEGRFRQHGVEYALQVASAMGHLDVVTWICGNCEIFLNVPAAELHAKLGRLAIWKDALLAAAQAGQLEILAWLHEMFTFFQHVPSSSRKMAVVKSMADAAAGYGQLRVLRWLQAVVDLPSTKEKDIITEEVPSLVNASTRVETSFVSTDGLLEAMVNRHVDVVQWVCAVDINLVSRQTIKRRGELATFLREEVDGFVPSKLGCVFPPL